MLRFKKFRSVTIFLIRNLNKIQEWSQLLGFEISEEKRNMMPTKISYWATGEHLTLYNVSEPFQPLSLPAGAGLRVFRIDICGKMKFKPVGAYRLRTSPFKLRVNGQLTVSESGVLAVSRASAIRKNVFLTQSSRL